jgi:hypothetical protein
MKHEWPFHIVVFAAKAANDRLEADNRRFLEADAQWRMHDLLRPSGGSASAECGGARPDHGRLT